MVHKHLIKMTQLLASTLMAMGGTTMAQIRSQRRFVGIDLGKDFVLESATISNFWRLANDHKLLGEQMFAQPGQISRP